MKRMSPSAPRTDWRDRYKTLHSAAARNFMHVRYCTPCRDTLFVPGWPRLLQG